MVDPTPAVEHIPLNTPINQDISIFVHMFHSLRSRSIETFPLVSNAASWEKKKLWEETERTENTKREKEERKESKYSFSYCNKWQRGRPGSFLSLARLCLNCAFFLCRSD